MTPINIHTKLSLLFAAVSAAFMMHFADTYVYGAAEDFSATVPHTSEKGVITLDNDQKWFKATELENGRNYLITARNSDGRDVLLTADDHRSAEYIWHFYEEKMVSSTTPHYTYLYTDTHRLCCHGNDLYLTQDWWSEGDQTWNYSDGRLFYIDNGQKTYLTYTDGAPVPFGCTDNAAEAADIELYTSGEELARCIKTQPCAQSFAIEGSGYSAPEFTVELLNDSIVADSVKWFIDGEESATGGLSFTADALAGLPTGVHHVSCIVEAHDSTDHYYREKSQEALFVIAKGAVPDSVITFSDIHEQYDLISKAIENVLDRTDGYIPSLIVCTGDMINGPTMDYDTMINTYAPRIKPYLGGLDTVYVAGNHDASKAVSELSIKAGLGADSDFSDGCGVIFRGNSAAAASNGKSSTAAKDIIVYGINYGSLESSPALPQDYSNVKSQLESFLKETARNYKGEIIIISAHAGLHALGVQPQSGSSTGAWAGSTAYNISNSYDIAELINSYAVKYDMNILYLFGHDHSRGETEFILTEGDTIICPTDSADWQTNTTELGFTYAHSGYLSTVIGSADAHFSFIYRNGNDLAYELFRAGSSEYVRHTDIPLKNLKLLNAASPVSTAKALRSTGNSPKTSGRFSITPFLIISLAMVIISRKRRK
ncbi:MAG: metallophosphoesterase [Ruminococcus sp.]|uniref:metallophosphoesterase n=1 Tax=Ruminococcus sp. TaxID=41978 RepID=UPI0025D78CF4|nr:metallophosphoesterase [Ruminococcus sp.]MBR5683333.1 metallophosphoesterase [Ruminococcus sp.]